MMLQVAWNLFAYDAWNSLTFGRSCQRGRSVDRIDRRIVRELQADGRLTNQELAERVNLSPSPCLRRVRLLEEAGVIRGYTAIVDQEKVGLPVNAFVSVRLERPSPEAMRSFEERIQRFDEIQECYLMTGTRDYLLHVVSQSLKTYEQFVREQLTQIPGIGAIETSFAFGRVKRINCYPAVAEAGEHAAPRMPDTRSQ